jgi:hypothetical protein
MTEYYSKMTNENKKWLSTVAKMAYSECKTSPTSAPASFAPHLRTGEGRILLCPAPLPPAPLPPPPLRLIKWLRKYKMTEEITKSPMKHKMTKHYGKNLKMTEQNPKNDWRKSQNDWGNYKMIEHFIKWLSIVTKY